jgi:hypothetical protein
LTSAEDLYTDRLKLTDVTNALSSMAGYDDLSNLLGSYPELVILRRFGPLAAQVLLHLQAELLELADTLKVLADAEKGDPDQRRHAKSWASANESVRGGRGSLRKELIEEAEVKLLRYCQCAYGELVNSLETSRRHILNHN